MQPRFPFVLGRMKNVLLPLLLLALMVTLALQHARSQEPAGDPYAQANAFMAHFEADQLPSENLEFQPYTPCVAGMAGIYPCDDIDMAAFLPNATMAGTNGNDIWGWTDPDTGKEYALMGHTNGTSFTDVTVPDAPVFIGRLPTATSNSSWRDIKVYNNHAFIVSEAGSHGMQVFDLTRLRTAAPPATFTADTRYTGFGNAHNLVINEESGFAYAVGTGTCSGGLHMVNIQSPLTPTNAGCFSSDGYTHDAQCVIYRGPDASRRGREICFNSNEDTLTIVDVTVKSAPVQLSRTPYAGSRYTHQAWLTEDHRFILLDDELDEQNFGHNTRTRIFDVQSLSAPVLTGFHDAPVPAIDHNLYNVGHFSYMSNYRSGLRIVNINNVAATPPSLVEVGFFDIYPSSNSASFNGAWSVYPYFESGTVIVSGIEQGLFVLKPQTPPDYVLSLTDYELDLCAATTDSTTIDLRALYGYTGNVTLGTENVAAGLNASVSPTSVSVPGSSTLTVTLTGSAPAYSVLTLTATDGTYSDKRYIGVRTDCSGPTPTATSVPPTVTATSVPPTVTATSVPPTVTATSVPPTATLTPPPAGLNLYLPLVFR